MFKLVISDDEGKQTVVPLVRDEITIGRKEGNTIRLTERNVSRRHARLLKSNGKFVIEDLHSYNGVRVNGQRIGAETALDAGDQVTIGDYQLALQVEQAEQTLPEQMSPAVADADTAMIAAPGPPARLVMITPPAPGAEFALTAERTRIGRAEDLDVWVNHRSISREHAEVQKEPDGGLRLIDLGSANGVRVNGQDVQNALLQPGDVVELGQVRFRFVAAGEHYAFDADRTVQMDALSVEPRSSKAPLLAAAAIVGLAVIGAGVIAVTLGDDGDETHAQAGPVEMTAGEGAGASTSSYQAALDACNDALTELDATRALAQARAALEARPEDEAATRCQQSAQNLQSQQQRFDRGRQHLDRGEFEQAYFEFDGLPEDSPFRSRPEVRHAVRSYATFRLREGRDALSDDPNEALSIAEFVLTMVGLTPEQQAQAAALQRDARDSGGNASEVAVARANPRRRTPRRTNPRRGRRAAQSAQQASEPSAPTRNETPEPTPTRASAGGGGGGGGAGLDDQVRACVMRGDNPCVIRLLEGHWRTPRQLAQLIEAYRARSQQQQAIRHMRTYVARFGSTPAARNYRQILARQ